MTAPFHTRTTCCLCGSGPLELVVPLAPVPCVSPNVGAAEDGTHRISVPLDIHLCRACGHVQLATIIDPALQYENYRYTTSVSLGLARHFETLADDVMARIRPPAGGLVAEIGSNDGTVLRLFRDRGMRVVGVDPAREIARQATESGVQTYGRFFTAAFAEEMRATHGAAAVVIANNVFANLDDLTDMVAGIRRLLADDGVFVFETQYGVDVFENTLLDTVYHEHISYFNVAPLARFFAAQGMELIDIQRIPTKGGSIRGTAQLADGGRTASPSVAELTALEARLGYDRPEAFRTFAARIAAIKAEVTRRVAEHKAAGRPVVGYGASVGTVTLLNYFELTDAIEFIADDTPLGPVLAGPDYAIPIVSPDELYHRPPGCVVVLAWRYAEPIIGKHQAYLERGGEFLIPLPDLSIRRAS